MAIKYQTTGPHGWSVTVVIEDGQALEFATTMEGRQPGKVYLYEARALTAPELLLVRLHQQATEVAAD